MAERRMFAMTIIDSDAFLDMPLSSQALYFHLSMRADDDGFINNPKKIQRVIGCSDDDLKLLVAKRFIIPFESGIVVIKHWKIHNYIRADRKKDTMHTEEMEMLEQKENGAYTISKNLEEIPMSDTCQTVDGQIAGKCQHRLGKDRIGKVSIGKDSIGKKGADKKLYAPHDEKLNQAILDFIDFRKKIKSPMTDRAIDLMINKLNKYSNNADEQIEMLNQSIMNGWKGIFPLDEKKDKNNNNDFLKEWVNEREGIRNDSFSDTNSIF
jgi:hypothetical protein